LGWLATCGGAGGPGLWTVDVVDVVDVVDDPTVVLDVLDVLELGVEVVVEEDVEVVAGWVVVATGCVVVVVRCGPFVAAPDWPAVVTSVRSPERTVSAVTATTDGLRRWSRCGTATSYFRDGESPVGPTCRSRLDRS
jgi:hypothetical protein